jgi:hypothetical protein
MKGICFIEPLSIAVINGTKLHTRRIITPQPNEILYLGGGRYGSVTSHDRGGMPNAYDIIKPKYKVGEKVYLKEPYKVIDDVVFYKYGEHKDISGKGRWKNKLFMPADQARYFMEIIDVRCERLQDISDEDCIKEGIVYDGVSTDDNGKVTFSWLKNGLGNKDGEFLYKEPQKAYADLIDSINGKGTWESNPYTWVYEFKLIK